MRDKYDMLKRYLTSDGKYDPEMEKVYKDGYDAGYNGKSEKSNPIPFRNDLEHKRLHWLQGHVAGRQHKLGRHEHAYKPLAEEVLNLLEVKRTYRTQKVRDKEQENNKALLKHGWEFDEKEKEWVHPNFKDHAIIPSSFGHRHIDLNVGKSYKINHGEMEQHLTNFKK
jgi:ribosome modulation factor